MTRVKIDEQVEPLVREALGAVIARDSDRFSTALTAVASAGDLAANKAVNLALRVAAYALLDVHEGSAPDDEQIRELAKSFCEMEEWAAPDEQAAVKLLTVLGTGTSVDEVLSPEQTSVLVFLLGGWLLSAFLDGDKHWPDYLDNILDALEREAE
jgi:hypothetical protein